MRKTAIAVGALFWISNLATIVGSVITGAVPSAPEALRSLSPHATQIVLGSLITHINDVAIIGYAVVLLAVLKRFDEGLALGYVAFKVVEAVLLLVGATAFLSVIPLSQSYLAGGMSDTLSFETAAQVALAQQFWAGRMAALAYLLATPILDFLLYRSRLVPRFISVFGLVALAMLATGLATGVGDATRGFEPGQLLVIPILLWELLFATWLLVKGFAPSAGTGERQIDHGLPSMVTV